MENIEDDIKISHGFDRGIDYETIKKKLIKCSNKLYEEYEKKPTNICIKRIVFTTIAMIQLRNGSRISEAVKAFISFMKNGISNRVMVKVSKTGAIKIKKDGTKFKTKVRGREMMWPSWINTNIYDLLKNNEIVEQQIKADTLKKRVLDYLLINFDCNTHSLRYAFINYALYVLKRPINDVAKHIGQANVAQMVTYTQQKNADQLFELNI